MALIIQVGEKSDMKPVPSNFPKCGNYLPEPLLDENNNIRVDDSKQTNSASHYAHGVLSNVIFFLIIYLLRY